MFAFVKLHAFWHCRWSEVMLYFSVLVTEESISGNILLKTKSDGIEYRDAGLNTEMWSCQNSWSGSRGEP